MTNQCVKRNFELITAVDEKSEDHQSYYNSSFREHQYLLSLYLCQAVSLKNANSMVALKEK